MRQDLEVFFSLAGAEDFGEEWLLDLRPLQLFQEEAPLRDAFLHVDPVLA